MGKIVETGMTKVDKNFNNNDNDAAEAEGEADIDMESDNTQGHIDAYNGNYTMYKYNDHCVENDVDRDDMSESSELTTELVSNATNLLTSLPDMVESYSNIYNKSNRIGVYTREERAIIIRRFHEKRARRVWKKKIRYHCRKNLADRRLRVKGRFIKAGSIEASKLGLEENHETTGDSGVDRDSDSVDIEQSNSRSSTNANASVSSSPSDIAPKISNKTKKEKNGKLIPNETMNQSVSLVSEENSDNGSNAASNAFDGFVGSPKSENAARNSLSVLLSVDSVNDNASAVVDGVSTSNTGKETNTDNLSMLGLYLLGKASQSSNHANGGVKNETNMYSNFNSGDKMRRHSIAY